MQETGKEGAEDEPSEYLLGQLGKNNDDSDSKSEGANTPNIQDSEGASTLPSKGVQASSSLCLGFDPLETNFVIRNALPNEMVAYAYMLCTAVIGWIGRQPHSCLIVDLQQYRRIAFVIVP